MDKASKASEILKVVNHLFSNTGPHMSFPPSLFVFVFVLLCLLCLSFLVHLQYAIKAFFHILQFAICLFVMSISYYCPFLYVKYFRYFTFLYPNFHASISILPTPYSNILLLSLYLYTFTLDTSPSPLPSKKEARLKRLEYIGLSRKREIRRKD